MGEEDDIALRNFNTIVIVSLQLFYICVYIYVSVSCSQAGIDRAEQVLSSLLMGENQFDSRREIAETRRKK